MTTGRPSPPASVTQAMAGGDRAAPAGEAWAPGELTAALDEMARALGREGQIHRDRVAGVAAACAPRWRCRRPATRPCWTGSSLRDEVLRLARMVGDLQALAAAVAAALRLARRRPGLAGIAASAASAASSLARRSRPPASRWTGGWRPGPRRPRFAAPGCHQLQTSGLKFTRPAAASPSPPGGEARKP